ncbi:hypothetical protein CALCODRAFT_486864 [Calocera cornea HHB12733]|uniref:Uncharacterized protein n=1 Tax=Calocera cornea HHB12733 TaxID=1353952 RepID=A0A165DHI0_9BASI|nr:hypothetical protein CALCODRAFT_486864 [Calocera cornea HHB12733]
MQRTHYQGGKSPVRAVGMVFPQAQTRVAGHPHGPAAAAGSGYGDLFHPAMQQSQMPVGYNLNHVAYPYERERVKRRMLGPLQEWMRVDASVHIPVEGKSKTRQLGTSYEQLEDVPARLTASELKQWVFKELEPKFRHDSRRYPFVMDDFELHGRSHTNLEKKAPDQPAVYDKCCIERTKSGVTTKTFVQNQVVLVMLVIKAEVWPNVEMWIALTTIASPKSPMAAQQPVNAI